MAHKMQRLTARLLLVLLLAGTFTPAALAVSMPTPHACCARKTAHQHSSQGLVFQSVSCEDHRCCAPVTKGEWAESVIPDRSLVQFAHADRVFFLPLAWASYGREESHAVRAPPRNLQELS
ncbi:MAG: hypothetical protein DMG89_11535 [Acidobacteria bacterium]|nr:MAG: hypothetical protein DMG89_11535 [Acidobacteriota bacterium]